MIGNSEPEVETLFRVIDRTDTHRDLAAADIEVRSLFRFFGPRWARITVPTLLLIGEVSTDPSKADVETVAAALPNARIGVLADQQHLADVLAPEVIAEHLIAFLRDGQH